MQAVDNSFHLTVKSNTGLSLLLILSIPVLSILAAYLVVNGEWYLALGTLLLLPGIILLHRYPWLALIIWLLLDPFLLHTPTSPERRLFWMVHRALPLITLGIILLTSALQISRRRLPKLGVPELAMAGYVILSLFSIWEMNASPLATTYLFYDRVIIPMVLYLIIRFTIQDGTSLYKLLPAMVFIALSQSIIGILSWYAPHMLRSQWLTQLGSRTIGTLINAGVYTSTLTMAGLLVLLAGMSSPKLMVRRFSVLTFYLTGYCIFISFSRASWLGGMIVISGLLYLYPKFTFKTILVVSSVLVIAGGWLLADQIQWAQARLKSDESERSALSRLPVFYAAYRMFQTRPLLGWGYGNFDQYDRRFQERVADLPNDNKDHASHNLYLTTIAEQGLLGLSLFLLPVIWLLFLSIKAFPRMPTNGLWSQKLLIILWLVIMTHFAVNSFQNMRVVFGLGMWWITLGLLANLTNNYLKPNSTEPVSSSARYALLPLSSVKRSAKASR